MCTPPCFCLSQSPSPLRRLRPGPRPRRPLASVALASGAVRRRSRVLGFLVLGSVVGLGCIVSVGWPGLDGPCQVTSCFYYITKAVKRSGSAPHSRGARSAAERAPKCTRTKRTGSGRRGSSRVTAGSSPCCDRTNRGPARGEQDAVSDRRASTTSAKYSNIMSRLSRLSIEKSVARMAAALHILWTQTDRHMGPIYDAQTSESFCS